MNNVSVSAVASLLGVVMTAAGLSGAPMLMAQTAPAASKAPAAQAGQVSPAAGTHTDHAVGQYARVSLATVLYSAEERALLDGRRPKQSGGGATDTPSEFRFDGYVRQAGQTPVVWLNGDTTSSPDAVRLDGEYAIVRINGSNRYRLAAGQRSGQSELGDGNTARIVDPAQAVTPAIRQWQINGVAREGPR